MPGDNLNGHLIDDARIPDGGCQYERSNDTVFDKNMSAGLSLNCSVMLLYLNLFRECQYKMFEKKYQL